MPVKITSIRLSDKGKKRLGDDIKKFHSTDGLIKLYEIINELLAAVHTNQYHTNIEDYDYFVLNTEEKNQIYHREKPESMHWYIEKLILESYQKGKEDAPCN